MKKKIIMIVNIMTIMLIMSTMGIRVSADNLYSKIKKVSDNEVLIIKSNNSINQIDDEYLKGKIMELEVKVKSIDNKKHIIKAKNGDKDIILGFPKEEKLTDIRKGETIKVRGIGITNGNKERNISLIAKRVD
ncbi:hypothetical protein [Clostridium ihumii]|uniref:hypothetical protein n=1 Tax=Clostridium ihumii TaxID=1470356 RepID=UPI0005906B1D|nr:hypothetical protein [Clostridium ihumii]